MGGGGLVGSSIPLYVDVVSITRLGGGEYQEEKCNSNLQCENDNKTYMKWCCVTYHTDGIDGPAELQKKRGKRLDMKMLQILKIIHQTH